MSKISKSYIKGLGLFSSITNRYIAYGIFYLAAAFLFISISTTDASAQNTCDPPCERGQICNDFGLCVMSPGECFTDSDCTPPESCVLGNCIVLPEGECETSSDCPAGEFCLANTCVGGPGGLDCDDNNPCTRDTVGYQCTPLCLPGQSCCSEYCIHDNTNEGGLCDDGDACTAGSACSSGTCTGGSPVVCDDGLFCNGLEACDSDMGGCITATQVPLDDGVACTDDSCDEVNDIVLNIPNNANCDNGLFCDGSETCDASAGCLAGTPPNTNDNVACTDDSCDEVNDIVLNIPNNTNCDNGLFCDGSEICSATLGCEGGPPPNTDDGVACTDDSCDEVNDVIVNTANNANCDNGLFCDGSETCDASQGCLAGTAPEIDDGVACTDDSCDEANDVVVNTVNNANCDNGLFCDGSETCDAAEGCQAGTAPEIDDGVACTDDSCDEDNDSVLNIENDANCDNGLFCDGEETCNAVEGCQAGTAPTIDDGIACTDDSCDEDNDSVLNIENDANCDNGLFCDGEETCDASQGCQAGTAPDVDDGVACTDDSCDEDNDVVLNEINDSFCDNGLFCDGEETCDAVLDCQAGTAPDVDDGVACTDDSCDEDNDIVLNTENDANCDNGVFCDGTETCDAALDCQAATNPPTGEACGENPEGICIDLACVFDGSITIAKLADPNDGTDFLFGCTDSDGLACGSIGDDSGMFELDDEPADTDGIPGSETFTEVLAGVYSVQEVLPPGWQSVDIVCENDDDDGTVIDMEMAEAFIDLDPGENITCTFFNFDPPVEIEFNDDVGYLVANDNNSLYVTGATPNKKVVLIWGGKQGIFTIGGNLCPGLELGIRPPKILGSYKADEEGMINSLVYVPFMDFALAYVQAADTGNCSTGDVIGMPVLNE